MDPAVVKRGSALLLAALPGALFAQAVETPPDATAPVPNADEVPAAGAAATFDVLEYRVLGNTVLPPIAIERAVYPHLGPARQFTDVEAARSAVELAYREAGYATVFVDLPEQEVNRGIVRLRVTEGRIDRVRITGARYFSNGRMRAALPSLARGSVPKFDDVQREVNALNRESADRSIVPILKAGRAPGTVDIALNVSDELPAHGNLEVNNRSSANTSELRLTAGLRYDNLFQRQHSLSLQYQVAPENRDDVEAYVASYVFRTRSLPDTTFAVYGVRSNTDVAALGDISVLGNGRIYGLRAIHALEPRANYAASVSFGLDYKDFLEQIRLADDDDLETPISYLNWSLGYNGTWRGERSRATFNAEAALGARRIFNSSREFGDKRFKGDPNYFALRLGGGVVRDLPWSMQLAGNVSGQFAAAPLVSNEQFAIGGAQSVRGYLESSQLGDYGFAGSFELRNTFLSRPLGLPPDAAYLFAFYDAGIVAILEPLPSQTREFDLASWGLGLRVDGWHGLDLSLDWARALVNSGSVEPGDSRAHFTVRFAF